MVAPQILTSWPGRPSSASCNCHPEQLGYGVVVAQHLCLEAHNPVPDLLDLAVQVRQLRLRRGGGVHRHPLLISQLVLEHAALHGPEPVLLGHVLQVLCQVVHGLGQRMAALAQPLHQLTDAVEVPRLEHWPCTTTGCLAHTLEDDAGAPSLLLTATTLILVLLQVLFSFQDVFDQNTLLPAQVTARAHRHRGLLVHHLHIVVAVPALGTFLKQGDVAPAGAWHRPRAWPLLLVGGWPAAGCAWPCTDRRGRCTHARGGCWCWHWQLGWGLAC
mmetsp:Transcript_13605/g.29131  ORF Transcript_13605/g.29131 Transcript_13605/m.29131 type:complete len:273 (-) Transcript_13605:1129-1947(-)